MTFAVAEDSPEALVLENRGTRYFVGGMVLAVGGIFAFSPLGQQKVHLGASDVTGPARLLLGAFLLWGFLGALDRQRLVFDAASGTVEFTSRMRPWARWRQPLADIAAVETSQHEESYYSSSPGSVTTVERSEGYVLAHYAQGDLQPIREVNVPVPSLK